MTKDNLSRGEIATLRRIHDQDRFWGDAATLASLCEKGMLRRYKYRQPDGMLWSLTKNALPYCRIPQISPSEADFLRASRGYVVIPADEAGERMVSILRRWGGLQSCHPGYRITRRGDAALALYDHDMTGTVGR